MKVCLYAGDMTLNRKVCRIKREGKKIINDFIGNKTVKTFLFLVQMFYSPMGYLPSIVF